MQVVVVVVILSVLGATVSSQYAATVFPYFPKNGQAFYAPETTTLKPQVYTETSMSPQTSVSVHHTVVRNKPAYPYPYTESSMQSEGSEDTSYYYTYEDTSEENKKSYSTTPLSTSSSTAKSVRSFWNSQKAQLDARRKESAQRLLPTYSKPTAKAETRPKIEFKVREKPKFGQANKNKEAVTESTVIMKENKTQNDQVTTPKSVKYGKKESNSIKEKGSEEEDMLKSSSKSSSPALQNQIIGRVGEIPIPNQFASQIQSPIRTQGNFGTSRQSKFDHSAANIQYVDNTAHYQQPALRNNLLPLANTVNQLPPQLIGNSPDPISQKQQPLTSNQQAILTNQNLQESIQALLNSNQQAILKMNQQPLLRSNPQQPLNNNPPALINNVQQPSIINRPPQPAFISASPVESVPVRSAEQYVNTNSPASTLLQRLGTLGLNLAGGGLGDGLVQGRDGGYGPSGLTFDLGPVRDPLQILLKLLSFLPRPLLDLNGRLFFGIELGKNAGLRSGVGVKPVGK